MSKIVRLCLRVPIGATAAVFAGFLAQALLLPSPAAATHFRFGQVNWKPADSGPANAVDFSITLGYRRTFFSGSAPDGYPQPGDVISVDPLSFGDSSSTSLSATVTDYNTDEDWLLAKANVSHTYASAQDYLAYIESGNRLSPCSAGNAHFNNPDGTYRVETTVDVGTGNSSPVSCLPPVVRCPAGEPCSFQIPTSDNDGDTLSFRLSTAGESDVVTQPGAGNSCTGGTASVSGTGLYSWNSAGCSLASGSCTRTFYSTQATMEESTGDAKAAIDFLIQLVDCDSSDLPPEYDPSTPCGQTLTTTPGQAVSFDIIAFDNDDLDLIGMSSACAPLGSSTTPPLPQSGNPAISEFEWTPGMADIGQHVMTFSAVDSCGQQTLCPVTIDVSEEVCDNGTDDDGDTLADCDDPDCASSGPCLPTPTATATATSDATDTPTATQTPVDTSTPTNTPVPTATAVPTQTIPPGGSALILRKLKIKANTATRRPNGKILARGVLNVNRPLGGFAGDVGANGLSVRFSTGNLNQTVTWAATDCETKEPRSGRISIRCRTSDGDHQIKFKPVSGIIAPNVFQVTLVSRRHTFPPPVAVAPVTMIIDVTDPDPADTIGETGTCKGKGSLAAKLVCREKGIFEE